ncbi:MAG: glutamate ligase domain-containing protein [Thermomicrobiales bacterium]
MHRYGAIPVIAIAGSRGKSTVVRALDAIFRSIGLKTATWTNAGVELCGRRQRGELAPWSRALGRLREGSLDVAIQELDWATVHAVKLPRHVYPIVAITNVCVNNDACLIQAEAKRALAALPTLLSAVHNRGALVLNGEDYAVSGEEVDFEAPAVLAGQSKDTPLIRSHLRAGGLAIWVNGGGITIGNADQGEAICSPSQLPYTLHGEAAFQTLNIMVAAAVARSCGLSASAIGDALAGYEPDPLLLPGSFNVVDLGGATAIVERPDPSWFLRPALRAVRDLPRNRLITVAGTMAEIGESDLVEVGRLLARTSSMLILHSERDQPERAKLIRQGIALNDIPPVILHTTTERRAVSRALEIIRPGDAALLVAENAPSVLRCLFRATGPLAEEGSQLTASSAIPAK